MRLGLTKEGKMWLGVLLVLLLCSSLEGQENSFTINSVHMVILPKQEVQNGENLTLQCIVDISTTSHVRPQHQLLFYKNDEQFYNVSSMKSTESYFIPQARVYNAGIYKCTVILNNKMKTTSEYEVMVRGVSSPRVTLDKKEAIEGGVVIVNCSVPNEKAPVHFIVEKVELDKKGIKQKREKNSQYQNFVTLDFTVEEQDRVIYFLCQASIVSGRNVETSATTRSDLVTVRESFSNPQFYVHPAGVIIEGDQLHIKCIIQVTPMVQAFPEIIIQRDKTIVGHSKQGSEATYSVMATMKENGNYTCKVETSQISKVSSIVVNITELFPKPKLESSATHLDEGDSLNLWCSVPHTVDFAIQKGDMNVSQAQNFTKIVSKWDGGNYTCIAGLGKVIKKSNQVLITVCEMLSRPRIFYDSKSEVIKGQTIEVHCQSINGTTPISYHLLKASNIVENYTVGSNEPAVFKDNPTEDTEYQCLADNCHSSSAMISEPLVVKVIAPVVEVKLAILNNKQVESGDDLVLRCFVNKASGPITYKFYREEDVRPFHVKISNETQAMWYKSPAGTEQGGQYYCTASNRANPAKNIPQSNLLTVRAKQMPVEMSRPAAPLLTSNNEKMPGSSTEANRPYGYDEDIGNHETNAVKEKKEPLTLDVEYTEVEVNSLEPHEGLGRKGTETVYSEIRKANPGQKQPWSRAQPDPQNHSRQNLNSNMFPDVSDADNI
ncbi:PREDICTED: platelet endothelial cell adhesion molecule isoform X5 [Myotis brandtii]|uniref:platelet endothelial cell adhesion molecule isoform X5 n=1 Tax=Myotis brandtii TaxID=109478 RepID=UPI0007043061|nr:PREDICTED: platelet endothelial cell adhesion molecule isoform X5 [Myotis brandtii]